MYTSLCLFLTVRTIENEALSRIKVTAELAPLVQWSNADSDPVAEPSI